MIATQPQLVDVDAEASPEIPQVIITVRHVRGSKPWEAHVAIVDVGRAVILDKLVRHELRDVAIAEALHFAGQAQDPADRGESA